LAESMALGIPTIASAYSGNVDFQNPNNCFPIGVESARVGQGAGPYEAHELWCEPSIDSAINALRTMVDDEAGRLQIVHEAQQTALAIFDPAVIATQVRKLLQNHFEVSKCDASTSL
jgi:glycosyltransferase involved in cell wall biosynthesis